jgi:micrococcal nuclease
VRGVPRARGWLPRGRLRGPRGLSAAVVIIGAVLCAALASHQARRKGEGGGGVGARAGGGGEALEPGRVARVDDGDTIRLADGRVVRYLGIDAPEEDEPYHGEAKARNESLVGGREVELRRGGPETSDRYGRVLALVHFREAGGRDVCVQRALLLEGLASVYVRDAKSLHPDVLQDLLGAQEPALAGQRGLWRDILERFRTRKEPLVSTRFRIHRSGCAETQEARPRPVESLEEELRRGKSLCRTCRPLRGK